MSTGRLILQGLMKYLLGLIFVALMLFVPAGTIYYWNGWLFIGLLFVPMFILGVVLLIKAPNLLEKRLNNKEKEDDQKMVVVLSLFMFLAGFVLSATDFRFGWSNVPKVVVIVAAVILLVSYALYAEVMRENQYLSRTVEVFEGQKVMDTGMYGIVRHPMYMTTVLLFLSIPVVLGSWIGFAIFLVYPFLLVKRIKNEEKILEEGLAGYTEYKKKVKYRMIPFIW